MQQKIGIILTISDGVSNREHNVVRSYQVINIPSYPTISPGTRVGKSVSISREFVKHIPMLARYDKHIGYQSHEQPTNTVNFPGFKF